MKTFGSDSILQAFSEALGKYRLYLRALDQSIIHKNRKLYIATSTQGFYRLTGVEFIQEMIATESISIIVIDVNKKVVKQWID